MPATSDQLNIRCDKDLKIAFIAQAKASGTTATDLIVDFMRQYLGLKAEGGRVSVPEAYRVPTVVNAINPAEIEDLIDSRLDVRLASLRLELLAEVEGKLAA